MCEQTLYVDQSLRCEVVSKHVMRCLFIQAFASMSMPGIALGACPWHAVFGKHPSAYSLTVFSNAAFPACEAEVMLFHSCLRRD